MTGFANFDEFLALPRVVGLSLAVDGSRLVAVIAETDETRAEWVTSLWEVDPAGTAPARRLTRSAKGERSPVFAADGSLLFVSARADDGADDEPAALWALPPAGEARRVLTRPGGVTGVVAAADANTVVVTAPTLPGSDGQEAEQRRVDARKTAKVSAILHRSSPVRYWDHDLGQAQPRLFATDLTAGLTAAVDGIAGDERVRDLTPDPGPALFEATPTLTPDGDTVITSWNVADEPGFPRTALVAIDVGSGERRVLLDDPPAALWQPAVARDGSRVVAVRQWTGDTTTIPAQSLVLIDLDDSIAGTASTVGVDSASRELVSDPDLWPESPAFAADGSAVFFLADQHGERPVFRVDLESGDVTRVTASGHYTDLQVSPDGRSLFALRDWVDSPPRPVRIDAAGTDADAVELHAPGTTDVTAPVERLTVTVEDGSTVHARLVLPSDASADAPAPLLLWVHGGPLGSWNSWSWRWNPWLMAGRGYAVLLPDPALSTGYGAAMIERGWGQWGGTPYTDLMAVTDSVVARPDIDESRSAAMGGSYGGYMANWIAGHTGRFRAVVTHASLWYLEQFMGTTDVPGDWAKEWGLPRDRPEHYAEWSPNRFLDAIRTPMLVIHGDRDYRVPIGEAEALWWDLQRAGVESAYLYFPDEGHWVLKPANAKVWYETVWAWLDQHVHGKDWAQPELL